MHLVGVRHRDRVRVSVGVRVRVRVRVRVTRTTRTTPTAPTTRTAPVAPTEQEAVRRTYVHVVGSSDHAVAAYRVFFRLVTGTGERVAPVAGCDELFVDCVVVL